MLYWFCSGVIPLFFSTSTLFTRQARASGGTLAFCQCIETGHSGNQHWQIPTRQPQNDKEEKHVQEQTGWRRNTLEVPDP